MTASLTLWLGAATLCLLTLLVVLAPRGRGNAPASARALYEARLAELEAEQQAGSLTDAEFAALSDELGASVLVDLEREAAEQPAATEPGGRPLRPLFVALALLVPTLGAATYLAVGEPDALWLVDSAEVLSLDAGTERSRLREIADSLTGRTASHPDDHESWYLLGHAHLKLERFAAAADAFEAVTGITGPDKRVDAYWLQARFLAANGSLDDTSKTIADRLLADSPSDSLTLEILALAAFRQGDYAQAAAFLQRALSGELMPSRRASLEQGLARARSELGELTPRIEVAITVAETPPAGSALFVLARPVGQRMPLAVVRQPAAAGIVSIRLDDTSAMNPAATLSSAEAVEVIARISRSGMAAADPADWRWQSDPLAIEPGTAHQLSVTLSPPDV